MQILEICTFVAIYLVSCNWFQLKSFIAAFLRTKKGVSFIQDRWITQTILKKTGVNIETITIFESEKMFGMMPITFPFKPNMILSREMYEGFTKDELEWVILHEAGHYILWHGIKLGVVQLCLLISGIYILNATNSISIGILCLLLFIFLYIQFCKYIEYEADTYSIARVDNPQGVITAQDKLIKSHNINEQSFITKYLLGATLPSQRIKLAKRKISYRSNNS